MNAYDVGDQVRLKAEFHDAASGALADPDAVTLTVRDAAGTVTTPAAAKDSTGKYHADVDLTLPGLWRYRWTGTGSPKTAEEGSLYVRPQSF